MKFWILYYTKTCILAAVMVSWELRLLYPGNYDQYRDVHSLFTNLIKSFPIKVNRENKHLWHHQTRFWNICRIFFISRNFMYLQNISLIIHLNFFINCMVNAMKAHHSTVMSAVLKAYLCTYKLTQSSIYII